MRDDHNREPLSGDVCQKTSHLVAISPVKRARRPVCQNDGGSRDKGPSYGDPLSLTARECFRYPLPETTQSNTSEHNVNGFIVDRLISILSGQPQILLHGQETN